MTSLRTAAVQTLLSALCDALHLMTSPTHSALQHFQLPERPPILKAERPAGCTPHISGLRAHSAAGATKRGQVGATKRPAGRGGITHLFTCLTAAAVQSPAATLASSDLPFGPGTQAGERRSHERPSRHSRPRCCYARTISHAYDQFTLQCCRMA